MADMVLSPRRAPARVIRGSRAKVAHLNSHSGMVRRTRPGISRIPRCAIAHLRFASFDAPRNDDSTRSARERAAVLFLGGGDDFELFVGTRHRRARREDVPLVL